jgi:hypothetical protein
MPASPPGPEAAAAATPLADDDARPEASADATDGDAAVCPNCQTARVGTFCHACGQRLDRGRFTMRTLAREAADRLFDADFRLWRTLGGLTVRPGHVVRAYLDGQRRRYLNPFTYTAIGAAINLLIFSLAGLEEVYRQFLVERTDSMATDLFTPVQAAAYYDAMMAVTKQLALVNFLLVVPFTVLVRLTVARGRLNLAETAIFALYIFAHVLYLGLPTYLLMVAGASMMTTLMATLALYVVVVAVASYQLFEGKLLRTAGALAVLVVSYLGFSIVLEVALMAYALLFF